MNSDTVGNRTKVVLDTNILISGVGFKGSPREILSLVLDDKITAITSPVLLAELREVIFKKFPKLVIQLAIMEERIKEKFLIVSPKETLNLVRDKDDNRVLEAAVEGNCDYIVTGDLDLLELKQYKRIKIVTPTDFLEIFNNRLDSKTKCTT